MWMRKIAVCVAAMSLSAAAWAAAPSDASVDELLEESGLREQSEAALQIIEKELAASMADVFSRDLSPAKRQRMQSMPHRQLIQILREEMGWEKSKPIYREIYKETFTQEEVDGMLVFYRSPVGQAMLRKTPQVMARSMQLSRERLTPRVTQRMVQLMIEMGENEKEQSKNGKGKSSAAAQ